MKPSALQYLFCLLLVAAWPSARAWAQEKSPGVDFNHDIRPILSNNCFMCHGPDVHQRKANLRFDSPDDAYRGHKTGTPIVPGDLVKSQLVKRITSSDPDDLMPPAKSEKKLSPRQIDLLKKWIASGAKYEKHWAFIPPRRAPLPEVKDTKWCRNPIDRFVLARLEEEGLTPSPEADKATLCRRLYFDLLGLPPTPKDVDDFVSDPAPDAYEKRVDQLLANPHFGERMALDWLDAARYADTHGYHIDSGRDQTHWRDWVIDAFNRNMPFDQFTIEQLAGDLLPNATLEQKIATGFVRNNMVNFEGGASADEYLTAYLIDRVSTTSTVWLGLTYNCCQCHDHKFDPLSQKSFYQLFAFFNGVPEKGLDGNKGNAGPVLALPSKEQLSRLETIAASVKAIEQQLAGPIPLADAEQIAWEKTAAEGPPLWTALKASELKSKGGATLSMKPDRSISVDGLNPNTDTYTIVAPAPAEVKEITAVRLEAMIDPKLVGKGPGRSNTGNVVLTRIGLSAGNGDDIAAAKPVKFKAASADFSQLGYPIANVIDENIATGWAVAPEIGKPHAAIFELTEPIHNDGDLVLTVTLAFDSGNPQHVLGHYRLSVTSSKKPQEKDLLPGSIRRALAIDADHRTGAQKAEVRKFFRTTVCSATRELSANVAKLNKEKEAINKAIPTTMVMLEMAKPRDTFVLLRGQYDKHGDKVTADVPENIAPLPADAPHNRLGLAEWIVSPRQPLTGRVIVNRYWQSFFGTGIVKTVEDFGSQGEEPTHPELLDWLAVQFREGGNGAGPWDVKAMIKLIVTSAAYRQSSVVTPALLARDPENRLIARGPRIRLPAEFIRDNALAISGLLNEDIGGRTVNPYQPSGLWEELMSRGDGANWTAQTYVQDHGKDLYRRTMYTFWKRTSPPASLSTFDAPDRETCTVRRARTNTPLQALVLMNDPTYVEAARKVAERMMSEAGASGEAKIIYAFRLATARAPTPVEIAVLKTIHDRELAVFTKDPAAATKLLAVGESPVNGKLDQNELAAWATVASVILNLDETITKG
ncbi:MAG TPA: PSD1 and planctomycete cytochrome C domain-containing protein [Tepidisphaeraceae bacterium]|jgi:hypothetical protein|nr:PSD1 and planctomycete cytochrome C domain-containing protein [Tepidisphaeraceae bacterium]